MTQDSKRRGKPSTRWRNCVTDARGGADHVAAYERKSEPRELEE
jgi:hypothetical protein